MSNISKLSEALRVDSLTPQDTIYGIRYEEDKRPIEIQVPVPKVFNSEDISIPELRFNRLISYPNMEKCYELDEVILKRMIDSNYNISVSGVIKVRPSLEVTGGKINIRFKNSLGEFQRLELIDLLIEENDDLDYIYIPIELKIYNLDGEGFVGINPKKILIHNNEVSLIDSSEKLETKKLNFNFTSDINLTNASSYEFELINLKLEVE